MKTVYKYAIPFNISMKIPLHADAKPIMAAIQYDAVCVWFEFDMSQPIEIRTFRIYGTGFTIPDDETHVGSCMTNDGHLVWHVYEK